MPCLRQSVKIETQLKTKIPEYHTLAVPVGVNSTVLNLIRKMLLLIALKTHFSLLVLSLL